MTHKLLHTSFCALPLLFSVACGPTDLTVGDKNPTSNAGGAASDAGGTSGDKLPDDKTSGGVLPGTKGDPSGGSDASAGAPADTTKPDMPPEMKPEPSFFCGDLKKTEIAAALVCNGSKDCPDGSDEANCDRSLFTCKDGSQISSMLLCNGKPDCKDGSDELACLPDADAFICKDGSKIPKLFVCTGKPECGDGSDELGCDLTCPDGTDQASRFDPVQKCWQAPEAIGCATSIDPAKAVPQKWPDVTCLHRQKDDAVFSVKAPQLVTQWLECTPAELMLTSLAKPCP